MKNPHVVVVPFPGQGHVIPLMELSLSLANHGFKISFINIESIHKRILDSFPKESLTEYPIRFISIPDGLGTDEERNNLGKKLSKTTNEFMSEKLEEIITKINESKDDDDGVVTCVITDGIWALEVAKKMGIPQRVSFTPASTALLALALSIPRLINDGIIDDDGTLTENQTIKLSPTIPVMNNANLVWTCIADVTAEDIIFRTMKKSNERINLANWIICNSSDELEPGAFSLLQNHLPNVLSIGPLLASNRLGRQCGHFWPEDSTCLTWLDQQPARSVVYVAFGSITIFEQTQFQELAYGLELSGKRFLWVTRPDTLNMDQDGFQNRVGTRGRIISWAPQQQVLSHPSVACFLSHCGWNSTMEGVSNGIPYLCWPYFAEQFLNQDYICDIWETGLRLNKDENGIINRKEISEKLNHLINDEGIRTRALKLMKTVKKSMDDGGSSSKNFEDFVKGIK